jgi:hypothetical protein
MEASLSLDNAVVNASILRNMTTKWRKLFLTLGMAIAVFGMRVVFPLLIVAIAGKVGPIEAIRIAVDHPKQYEQIITNAHVSISGFGGAFLLLVGLHYFFDPDKEVHWFKPVESLLSTMSKIPVLPYVFTAVIIGSLGLLLSHERNTFLLASLFGALAYFVVKFAGDKLQVPDSAQGNAAKAGLGAFLYLELLDASFSFDGVIGAFALSNNIFIIALGLGIGAMFVRSMTIYLVDKDTLGEFRYLEHGAFWAITVLGIIMVTSPLINVPEAITGLVGAVLIGSALYASVLYNRAHPDEVEDGAVVLPSGNYIPDSD